MSYKSELRKINPTDHKWLVDLHNDPGVLINLTHSNVITLDEHMSWWENIKNSKKELRYIFTVNDVPVGFTKFYDIDYDNRNCMLGADIHKNFRGKGYANAMWTHMLNFVFFDLSLHRASLTTASYNLIGQRVYKKLGFREEGKLIQSLYRNSEFHDQICMFMLRNDWVK